MSIVYAVLIQCYGLAIRIAALFNAKAKARISGLERQKKYDLKTQSAGKEIIWMHCASVGEFEQGRPVFEGLKKKFPDCFFLLSFFSASGFLAAQKYKGADGIIYLPADTKNNARKLLGDLPFKMALFVKYEFWYNHLNCLHEKKIPVFLVSGIFRPDQLFFRSYGKWFLQHLKNMDYFFVQDENSAKLLNRAGIHQVQISGDTRADRVLELSQSEFDLIKKPAGNQNKTLVCGSVWKEDLELIEKEIKYFENKLNWILVPHEINLEQIEFLKKSIEEKSKSRVKLFSTLNKNEDWKILIVDAMGYLSKLYRLGDMAYVGGGFGKGIHNILEPAAYGIPVLFGPKNQKFNEAAALKKRGGGFEILDAASLRHQIENWMSDEAKLEAAGKAAAQYLSENSGATEKIIEKITS